jgi:hypothetical protein
MSADICVRVLKKRASNDTLARFRPGPSTFALWAENRFRPGPSTFALWAENGPV